MKSCNFWTGRLIFFILRYFAYNMMYYRISKNEKNLSFGKKIAQVWAVTLIVMMLIRNGLALHFKWVPTTYRCDEKWRKNNI